VRVSSLAARRPPPVAAAERLADVLPPQWVVRSTAPRLRSAPSACWARPSGPQLRATLPVARRPQPATTPLAAVARRRVARSSSLATSLLVAVARHSSLVARHSSLATSLFVERRSLAQFVLFRTSLVVVARRPLPQDNHQVLDAHQPRRPPLAAQLSSRPPTS